jgi:hypothetical protein
MPFNITSTLDTLNSHLRKTGVIRHSQIGEYKSIPNTKECYAAIWMSDARVAMATLADTIEVHTVTVRLYWGAFEEPIVNIELGLAKAVSDIVNEWSGDFTLGATVRNIDIAGELGTPLTSVWGYADVSGLIYRIVDLEVSLIVDGSSTLAP